MGKVLQVPMDEEMLRALKVEAAKLGITLRDFVDQAMRKQLAQLRERGA